MNVELRKTVLRLYYLIKKAHVRHMPRDLRTVGDTFISVEFKQHITSSDPKFLRGFIESWVDYYTNLNQTKSIDEFTKSFDKDKLKLLSPEQLETLEKLKDSLR